MIQAFFIEHSYLIGIVSFILGWMGMPIVLRIAKAKGFVVRPNKRMVLFDWYCGYYGHWFY